MHTSWIDLQILKSPWMEKLNYVMTRRPIGAWGLVMLISVTPCCYVTINQSALCMNWSHTLGCPSFTLPLKMLCSSQLGSSGLSSTSGPGLLAWCPAVNTALSFSTTQCQEIGITGRGKPGSVTRLVTNNLRNVSLNIKSLTNTRQRGKPLCSLKPDPAPKAFPP